MVVAGALALAGCSKSANGPAPVNADGVPVMDMAKLRSEFSSADEEVRQSLDKAAFAVRYSNYTVALEELNKLSNNPKLSEAQKKAVTDFIDQLKKAIASAAPQAAQPAR